MESLKIVKTADGSNTIFNCQVGEHYHSRNGALQESRHVFVQSGLAHFLGLYATGAVSILEVGFGTGLNFLLSADYCDEKKIGLDYVGIEVYPLTTEMISSTGYENYVRGQTWNSFIKHYKDAADKPVHITNHCQLQIASCKLLDFQTSRQFDIIYFDAFAAAYQPEMWDEAAISHTIQFLKPNGIFVTYAITGNLKRMLRSLGCRIEKVPGAAGKREMLRAIKLPGC